MLRKQYEPPPNVANTLYDPNSRNDQTVTVKGIPLQL